MKGSLSLLLLALCATSGLALKFTKNPTLYKEDGNIAEGILDFASPGKHTLEFTFDMEETPILGFIKIAINGKEAMNFRFPNNYTFTYPLDASEVDFAYNISAHAGALIFNAMLAKHDGIYNVTVTASGLSKALVEASADTTIKGIKRCANPGRDLGYTPSVDGCKIEVTGAGCLDGYFGEEEPSVTVHLEGITGRDPSQVLTQFVKSPAPLPDGTFSYTLNTDNDTFTVNEHTPKEIRIVQTYSQAGFDAVREEKTVSEFNDAGCADWTDFCLGNRTALPPLAGVLGGLDQNLVCAMANANRTGVVDACRGTNQVQPVDPSEPATLTFHCGPCEMKWTQSLGEVQPKSKVMKCGEGAVAWVDEVPAAAGKWPYCLCPAAPPNGASSLNLSLGLFSSLLVLLVKAVL